MVFVSIDNQEAKMHAEQAYQPCQHCGTLFRTDKRDIKIGRKYCSVACYRAHEHEHGRPEQKVAKVEFSCRTCGKPFYRGPGELREYHKKFGKDPLYCSRECSHIGRTSTETKNCAVCGKEFTVLGHSLRRTETCSTACRHALQRQTLIAKNEELRPSVERPMTKRMMRGYVLLRFPSVGGVRGDDIYEHRYNMEQKIGRPLRAEETVHHINGDRTDNRIENLELFASRHGPGQRARDQVEWAIKLLSDYPEFTREAGYALTPIDQALTPCL